MAFSRKLSALLFAFFCTAPAFATSFTGSTVSGSIVPGGNPPYSYATVVTQFASPATVGDGVEFSGSFHPYYSTDPVVVTADFSSAGLLLHVTTPNDSYGNSYSAFNIFSLAFTDPAFAGADLSFQGVTCDANAGDYCNQQLAPTNQLLGNSLSGNTLTLSFSGWENGALYQFGQPASVAATPEPSSLLLLGSGLLGAFPLLRRRITR